MVRVPGRKAIPWMLFLEAAMILHDHWERLKPSDRDELRRIVRKSRGRPSNLTERERRELRRLVGELGPLEAGRRMMPLGGGLRRKKRR